ncbi:YdiU family protein [Porticoccus sp. W117]|uniref:protein adenylyltransferase SelO n=1 Tax=Porticoccus sp. W117 TaxID=3054777 RepID=UPI002597E609|nr:YdiU family protein [Porticoccus sp. W117]MDM3869983.1 YdiU family protein [Porticoccus sp. W117]
MSLFPAANIYQPLHQLGEPFYSEVPPQGLRNPALVHTSASAAELLQLSPQQLASDEFLHLASGNSYFQPCPPLATVYSGHQFGVYVPQLGDGRAMSLGTVKGPDGEWEMQLKGAGQTPYSRFGDGRAVMRSTIREYLCSEAMHGLGIATTRGLSITTGSDKVQRETVEPAAVLIRLARSHVRFGSFEFFHYNGQHQRVKQLADYVIERHHPGLLGEQDRHYRFLERTVTATAEMIAHWQAVGFTHGVMNTDNMSILGDTIDYGPFGFMDDYQPGFVCNHSDERGRYAFSRQPAIGLWNCNALAHALSSLVDSEQLTQALQQYEPAFLDTLAELMAAKLGLKEQHTNDGQLIDSLLATMADNSVDYTLLFRRLCDFDSENEKIAELFNNPDDFRKWAQDYRQRLQQQDWPQPQRCAAMKKANPKYILRNYLAEVAIRKAEDEQDYSEIDRLITLLASPFDEHPELEQYAAQPPEWAQGLSLSCSS